MLDTLAESFFATLKKELIHRRIRSAIGYVSPADFKAPNSNPIPAMIAA